MNETGIVIKSQYGEQMGKRMNMGNALREKKQQGDQVERKKNSIMNW